jgi:hypothetical protein
MPQALNGGTYSNNSSAPFPGSEFDSNTTMGRGTRSSPTPANQPFATSSYPTYSVPAVTAPTTQVAIMPLAMAPTEGLMGGMALPGMQQGPSSSMSGASVPGVLRVHVHRGEGFRSTHALTRAAPYVVIEIGGHARKTRYVKTTNGATFWDDQLELDVTDARTEWLTVRVQDRHRLKADGVVGRRAELPLQRLSYGQLHPADADTTEGRVTLTLVLLPPGQGYGKNGTARKMPNLTKRGRSKKRDGRHFRKKERTSSPLSSDAFSYSEKETDDADEVERDYYYRQAVQGAGRAAM